jgi:hypothetical protein
MQMCARILLTDLDFIPLFITVSARGIDSKFWFSGSHSGLSLGTFLIGSPIHSVDSRYELLVYCDSGVLWKAVCNSSPKVIESGAE